MRTASVLGATLVAGAAALMLPATAGAATDPYTGVSSVRITLGTNNPATGSLLGVEGSGFSGNGGVSVGIESEFRELKALTADGNGAFSTSVRLPAGFTCEHDIVAIDKVTGDTARASIVIGACEDGNDGSEGGGNLPKTGAQVLGFGLLGAALVGGGITLRRRAKANA